ncbi:unannotated protein [freshwater metagenome]|uniref:Unannotated protein n=1 Tax=freshwater metagenome TaxID=449393 RepID=A0A6J6M2E2_9ZZZZ
MGAPEIFVGAVDAVGQSLTTTCPDQAIVEVAADQPAPVKLVDVLPSPALLADFKTTSCPTGSTLVVPAFNYPVTLAFNEPGLEGIQLTPQAIAGILNGTVKTWDDPLIAASNEGLALDGLPALKLIGLNREQGDVQAMTAWLSKTAPDAWKLGTVGSVPVAKTFNSVDALITEITANEGEVAVLPVTTANNNVLGMASLPAGPNLDIWITADDVQLAKVGSAAMTDQTSTLAGGQSTDMLIYGPGLGGVPVEGQFDIAASKIVLSEGQELIGWPVMGVAHLLVCNDKSDPLPLSFAQYLVRLAGQGSLEAFGVTPLPEPIRIKTFAPLQVTTAANTGSNE